MICGNRQQPIRQTDFWHNQEGVTNKKLTDRVWIDEVQMGRHDKHHFANTQTQESNISLQSTLDRLGKTATVVKLHRKTD